MSQVGMENRAKIVQKAHVKYNEKKKASWRRLGGILEASWRLKNPLDALNPLVPLAVAGTRVARRILENGVWEIDFKWIV